MNCYQQLRNLWNNIDYPVLIDARGKELYFGEISHAGIIDFSDIREGDVVALIGDFDARSISILLQLIGMNFIVVPLTDDTRSQHDYFFESALVDVIIDRNSIKAELTTVKSINTYNGYDSKKNLVWYYSQLGLQDVRKLYCIILHY